jgi:hypothetical protein
MNKKFFEIYQYLAPVVLSPLSLWLWWKTFDENLLITLYIWSIPVIYAYIVPAIGINVLKVWEFDTRFRLGRFRPHHGFVFGSATATLAWICHFHQIIDITEIFRYGFILASVLGFWNVLFDIKAVESGMIKVYNQKWADGMGAEAIVMDYGPAFFAIFGAIYGLSSGTAEWLFNKGILSPLLSLFLGSATLLLSTGLSVFIYRRHSFRMHGHSGCRPVRKVQKP